MLRVLLAWLFCLSAAQADMLELRAAHVRTSVDGVVAQQEIELPYHWDRVHRSRPGEAIFELPFVIAGDPVGPYGIYFSRVGNTAEIWLNGNLLSRFGDVAVSDADDYVKAPQYVLIPARLVQKDNLLRIHIHADAARRAGLSRVAVGPEAEVRERFDQAYRWRVTVSIMVAVFSLVVSVIALLLWLTQGEHDKAGDLTREGIYLTASVAELCWMVRLSDVALVHPPLSWPWWNLVQTVAYAGWFYGAAMFCHYVAGWHLHPSMRWVRAGMLGLFLSAIPMSYASFILHDDRYMTGWYGFVSFLFIGYSFFYIAAAVRRPTTERLLVATAGAFNVVAGFRDWLVIRANDSFDEVSWTRSSAVLFGVALCYIVVTRFREASGQARDLMRNMEAKVTEKEQALAASFQQLEQLAREQERTAERTRILRDMHDGVGSHISAAIRQLQSGKASDEQLMQTLRDSLDQLKLSIDAMNLPPGDVTALLANLRYRLEPRLKASDIELQWDVDLLAPLTRFDGKAMRQLQFMVFEALSNVLQHAQASVLRIELRATPAGGARLRVIDNGNGFDPDRVQRKGLGSLRERAAAIGARLDISSAPGQTAVEIVLDPAAG